MQLCILFATICSTTMDSEAVLRHVRSYLASQRLPIEITVDLVASKPKKNNSLFQYAAEPPKVSLQECLLTFAASVEPASPSTSTAPRRIFVSACEIHIYTIPATDSTLVYVSKADSTGYSPCRSDQRAPAYTKIALKAFLSFFVSPATRPTSRVYLQLFARSQNQYLFPNSIEGGQKRVLGGTRLCRWWRNFLEELTLEVVSAEKSPLADAKDEGLATLSTTRKPHRKFLSYFLPSYEATEAKGLLGLSNHRLPEGLNWSYLPPNHPSSPSPLRPHGLQVDDAANDAPLSVLVPTFSDDPKGRFLLDLVQDRDTEQSIKRTRPANDGDANKRRKLQANSSSGLIASIKEKRKEETREMRDTDIKALRSVSFDEYWERMGFRQECVSGDVTGFFAMSIVPDKDDAAKDVPHPSLGPTTSTSSIDGNGSAPPGTVSSAVYTQLMETLLNHDFGTFDLALESTRKVQAAFKATLETEVGQDAWRRCCNVDVAKSTEVAPRAEPVAGPPRPPVTILAVKKKPKKT